MEYEEFLNEVTDLDFIRDEEEADLAIKAVISTLAGHLDEYKARKFSDSLPFPLSYDNLKEQQNPEPYMSVDEYVTELGGQFGLGDDEAQELIQAILRVTKSFLDSDTLEDVEENLPADWAETLDDA